jgi:tungstate transport system substrate-binding protein
MQRSKIGSRLLVGMFAMAVACLFSLCFQAEPAQCREGKQKEQTLMVATTTSVDATGLLDLLADRFKARTGIRLRWVAVGTGQALAIARDGNADAVIVHAKKLEDEFIREGWGVNRRVFARNYFMLVGPAADPARVSGKKSIREALAAIRKSGAPFVSRGDRSGTHTRELDLWKSAGGIPKRFYLETGQGMAQTLRVANEKLAYTLSDSATYFSLPDLSGLKPLITQGAELENIYSVIVVNPFKVKSARYDQAMAFAAFLTGPEGQALIGGFVKSGRRLFDPVAAETAIDIDK